MTPSDEKIDAMVEDLLFIDGPLFDSAAGMLLALKARADAAEHERDRYSGLHLQEAQKQKARAEELERLLKAASSALRSYQYGNSAPDLAQEIADKCDAALEAKT